MTRRWRTITVVALACLLLAFVVLLILWPRPQALSIDWQAGAAAETDRFACTIERVCHKKWSEIELDEIPDGEHWFRTKSPGLDSYFLFVQVRLKVDGYEKDEMPDDLIESIGPFNVLFGGEYYEARQGKIFFSTPDRKSNCVLVPVVEALTESSENWLFQLLGLESKPKHRPFITDDPSKQLQVTAGVTLNDGNRRELTFNLKLEE